MLLWGVQWVYIMGYCHDVAVGVVLHDAYLTRC